MTPTAATPSKNTIWGARVHDVGPEPRKWGGDWHRVVTRENPSGTWGSEANAKLVLAKALENDKDLRGFPFIVHEDPPEPTLSTIKIDDWLVGDVKPIRMVPLELQAQYRDTLQRAALAAYRYGHAIYVSESFRTRAQQERFWSIYQNGGALAARPGTSPHEHGIALDIPNARDLPELIVELRKLELIDDVPSEKWHVTNHHRVA